ncbi:hypothetical protein GCM10009844_23520 [Nocardioides koreensis]|uniref:Delta-60 repeat domain-containing protein n=1 Tax=Nocardioides koreensis TaxID=433651 RepID=A0ABP5LJH1_9ACTN
MLAAVVMLAAGSSPVLAARSGGRDQSFAGDGVAVLDFGPRADGAAAGDVLVTSSDKVVTVGPVGVGADTVFGVSRLRADGTPDRSFHGTGRRLTSLTGRDVPRRVIALGGGRQLVGGSAGDAFGLVAYRRDGSPDPGFGTGGAVTTDVTAGPDQVLDLRRRPDGSILAAGTAGEGFAIVRYRPDGTLDPGFGDAGVVVTTAGFWGTPNAVRLQPDGRLLVVGSSEPDAHGYLGFAVMRYTADGTLDETFGGGDGLVTTYPPGREYSRAWAVLVLPDGRLVVGGGGYGEGDYSYFCLARYLADGTPDSTFGQDGVLSTWLQPYYAHVNALARQGDGKIVAAGWTDGEDWSDALAVVRYHPDGTLDRAFSHDGSAVVDLAQRTAEARAVATRNGKIVLAGEMASYAGRRWAIVVRYRQ